MHKFFIFRRVKFKAICSSKRVLGLDNSPLNFILSNLFDLIKSMLIGRVLPL
jgi:hypothetical protein